MYIFNVYNDLIVRDVVVEYLKSKGVKYKSAKKIKETPQSTILSGVFQMPLKVLPKATVSLKNNSVQIEIPAFLKTTCNLIEQDICLEGLFRKGGSQAKQRELKQQINSGLPFTDKCHVIDACNLVKLFLRELPEPLISYCYHEMFLCCLLLTGEEAQREALLLSCLLINREHLNVLAYLLEFWAEVAKESFHNKMDAKNLAIVLTPTIMPIDSKSKGRSNFNINHHIAVVELLIKSASDVGIIPSPLADQVTASRGRKRRSASITKMFTGIRKIVGRGQSPPCDSSPYDQFIGQKRKSPEILPPSITVKRRREMADTTPRMCRMGGYTGASLPMSSERNTKNDLKIKSPSNPTSCENREAINKKSSSRKGGRKQGLKSSKSTSSLLLSKKKTLERKLSSMAWRKRPSLKAETPSKTENNSEPSDDVVTIPRKKYEEMVTRVSCMEQMLKNQQQSTDEINLEPELLAEQFEAELKIRRSGEHPQQKSTSAVQAAFERTVEQTEQMAPQISRNLRIRWSSENRVTRSPSQRKIGSIRRRSRELARSNSAGAKTSLQRGRPNTRQTGLKSPRDMSDPRRQTRTPGSEQWRCASSVLSSPSLANRLKGTPLKRDSIASIRRNNVGMVHAKAKFFDSLNQSTDGDSDRSNQSMERRLLAVQAEMQRLPRPLKENRQPAIKASLGAPSQLKTPRSIARPIVNSRATPLKALPDNISTPLRGVRRSPRILSRAISLRTPATTRTP